MNSRILCLVVFLSPFVYGSTRLFDACPSRRISIGACLAGLCPAGSECINNFCCKIRKHVSTTTTPYPEEEEENIYGKCVDGRNSIGECIEDSCPDGFICEKGLCCLISGSTFPRRFTMTPPTTTTVETTTVTVPSSIEITTTEEIPVVYPGSEEVEEESTTKTTTTVSGKKITKSGLRKELEKLEKTKKKGGGDEDWEREITTTTPYPEEEVEEEYFSTTPEPTRRTTTPTTTPLPESNICPVGEAIGECVSNQCPEGHTCYNGNCCVSTPEINCTDTLSNCSRHLCLRRGYKEFMTKNCARTCARCHIPIGDRIDCRDRRADCQEWAAEGFCSSTLYTTQQKMKFCGKSCNLC